MNKYLDKYYDRLKAAFAGSATFTIQQAEQVLAVKSNSTWQILSRLVKEGRLFRLRRGMYSLSQSPAVSESEYMGQAARLLEQEGIEFILTGLDVLMDFIQHQPSRVMHLIYTPDGIGDSARSVLRNSKVVSLLEPRKEEIENALASTEDEITVIRERSSRVGTFRHIATKERAFIDLYFETSRDLIPFPIQEIAYIYQNMMATSDVNIKQMVRYAHERKIDSEINLIIQYPSGKKISRSKAKPFIDAMGAIQ